MSTIQLTINLPNIKANELERLAKQLSGIVGVSGAGKTKKPRKPGAKKPISQMNKKELGAHFENKLTAKIK